MLSRQQKLRAYWPNIYTVDTSCKRRREKKIKMFCIALMVTFDLFKLTYRMTWVKKRRQTTRQLWHFTDENQGAKKFEKRNLAHFHTWAWFHVVYFSKINFWSIKNQADQLFCGFPFSIHWPVCAKKNRVQFLLTSYRFKGHNRYVQGTIEESYQIKSQMWHLLWNFWSRISVSVTCKFNS